MRLSRVRPLLFTLTSLSSALQVTPNSPCSTQCIDDINDNPTDPNSSNTSGKDITCNNADYNTTTVGQKFKSCVNCLQDSAYSSSTENDQSWYLYNLRYAVDWCLFGYPSNATTIGGPCLMASACGDLSTALESGIVNPSGGSTYDYCSADGGAFLGQNLAACKTCLMSISGNSYLSNFVVALEAGCTQQPASGTVIGLNDTVFTSTQVAITTASAAPTTGANSSAGSSSLSTGAKIGIIVGGVIVLLVIIGVAIIWWKKKQRRTAMTSNYDPRFGAPEITAPNAGAFVNPAYQTSPTNNTFVRYNPRDYNDPETSPPGELKLNSPAFTDMSSMSGSQPSSPPYTGTAIPVHQAYIQNPKQSLQGLMSPESPQPPNSAPIRTRTSSNSTNVAGFTPPNSAPIRTRNFSNPIGTTSQASQGSPSIKSNSPVVTPYDPSTYIPSSESESVQAQRGPPKDPNVPAPLRPTPGRQQAWNTESSHSVELWPGSM